MNTGAAPLVEVHPDPAALAAAVAGELLHRIADSQAGGHVPQICLTGGTIADAVHHEIARLAPASGVDWGAVGFWLGDERFVPTDSADRNINQARAALLDPVGARRFNTAPASSEIGTVEESAAAYDEAIGAEEAHHFDVLMLGVGPDGHIASLFPGNPALESAGASAVAVRDSPKPPSERVTLTFEALNRARSVWFLVSGEAKADAVRRALATDGAVEETPARGVSGTAETIWFLDTAAASQI